MLEVLTPLAGRFYTLTPASPRALSARALAEKLAPSGKRVEVCADAADAVRRAMAEAGPEDVICCVGSLYMTGAVRTACRELLG